MAPKRKILVGRSATEEFNKKQKLNEDLQSLTDAPIRLDSRVFVLSDLRELFLENVNLHMEQNCARLKNLPRLSKLKVLSLANNKLTEIPDYVFASIPIGLQQLVLDSNQLTELPRLLMRLRNLVVLHATNNKITFIHEDICLLRSLQNLKLDRNNLEYLPFTMLYGRRYRELDLTENTRLFTDYQPVVEQEQRASTSEGFENAVPMLKHIVLARLFNQSENAESLIPLSMLRNRDLYLRRCFICVKYVPEYGSLYTKRGRFDIRNCSEQVYYNRPEVLARYTANVCPGCFSKAVRFRIFP